MIQDPELPGRLLLEQYQVFKITYWFPKWGYITLQFTCVVCKSFPLEMPLLDNMCVCVAFRMLFKVLLLPVISLSHNSGPAHLCSPYGIRCILWSYSFGSRLAAGHQGLRCNNVSYPVFQIICELIFVLVQKYFRC